MIFTYIKTPIYLLLYYIHFILLCCLLLMSASLCMALLIQVLPSPFVCFYHTTNYHSNTLAAPQKRFFLISDDYIILWLPTYHLGRVFF